MAIPIKIDIIADPSNAQKAFGQIDATVSGFGEKAKGAGLKIGGAVAAAFAVDKVVDFGASLIQTASDSTESMNKVASVFGPSTQAIVDFSKTAANNLGLSRQEALNAAGDFGNMFDQLKIAPSVSADMSKGLVTLAADLGSFNNANTPEVTEALTSAFRGEYDALQRFIPTINAAAVEQKALEMTHKTSTAALTEQDKAMATYQLALDGAGKAQGDFAKTADSPANALKRAKAQWGDAKDDLARNLLPALASLASFMADNLPKAIDGAKNAFNTVKDAVAPIIDTVKTLVDAFRGGFENPDALVNTEGFLGTVIRLGQGFKDFVDGVVNAFNTVKGYVEEILPQVQEAIEHVLNAIRDFWRTWGDDIMNVVRGAFDVIRSIVETVINVVAGIIRFVLAVINGDWGRAWDALKGVVGAVWEGIKGVVSGGIEFIKGFLGGAYQTIKSAASGMFDGIKEAFKGALNWVIDKWNGFRLDLRFPNEMFGIPLGPLAGKGFTLDTPDIPKFAAGGIAPANRVIQVGERGPELVTLGQTSRIYNASDSARMMGGGGPVTINHEWHISGTTEQMVSTIQQMLKQHDKDAYERIQMGWKPL